MGIYDREYGRYDEYQRPPGIHLGGSRSLTTNLILVMVGVYLVQLLTRGPAPDAGSFSRFFMLHADLPKRPWMCFQLLTYGFLHDPFGIRHIVWNMVALFFFGRAIEQRYGPQEYLLIFLTGIAFSGTVWLVADVAYNGLGSPGAVLGASGGLAAVLILFVLNFPHQKVLLFFAIPIPAWVFGIAIVVLDMQGAMQRDGSNVAYTAHLGGALFAVLYFRAGRSLSDFFPSKLRMPSLKRRPNLKVHDPRATEPDGQVDDILRKIQEHGQQSLTRKERKILEQASRAYQKKRRE